MLPSHDTPLRDATKETNFVFTTSYSGEAQFHQTRSFPSLKWQRANRAAKSPKTLVITGETMKSTLCLTAGTKRHWDRDLAQGRVNLGISLDTESNRISFLVKGIPFSRSKKTIISPDAEQVELPHFDGSFLQKKTPGRAQSASSHPSTGLLRSNSLNHLLSETNSISKQTML